MSIKLFFIYVLSQTKQINIFLEKIMKIKRNPLLKKWKFSLNIKKKTINKEEQNEREREKGT